MEYRARKHAPCRDVMMRAAAIGLAALAQRADRRSRECKARSPTNAAFGVRHYPA